MRRALAIIAALTSALTMNQIVAGPDTPSLNDALHHALHDYARRWPGEAAVMDLFGGLLADGGGADPFTRDRLEGHFTASCWLIDRAGKRVLLTHHRKLERWLQLGGHADGDRDLARVALREAEEESGLQELDVEREIFDLDRHWIPARGDVLGHWHYDVRYVVRAGANEEYIVSEESHDLAWREIAEIAEDAAADESMRRMAAKWLSRAA
jgi:8-oxo-dGTP pyrophosphatase MutT (NUDIX family)